MCVFLGFFSFLSSFLIYMVFLGKWLLFHLFLCLSGFPSYGSRLLRFRDRPARVWILNFTTMCLHDLETVTLSSSSSVFPCKVRIRLPRWHSGKPSAYKWRRRNRRGLFSPSTTTAGGTKGREPARHCRRYETRVPPLGGNTPGEGNGKPLQYSCLENPMDRGACRAIVHGVTKSRT